MALVTNTVTPEIAIISTGGVGWCIFRSAMGSLSGIGVQHLSPSSVLQTSLGRWNSKAAFTLKALGVSLFYRLCVVKLAYYVRYGLQIFHFFLSVPFIRRWDDVSV